MSSVDSGPGTAFSVAVKCYGAVFLYSVLVLSTWSVASVAAAQEPDGAPETPAPPSSKLSVPTPGTREGRFVVVLDAAHGGSDVGARLADRLLEKDLALSLTARLHAALAALGIEVVLTRESDTNVPAVERAQIANHAASAACIILHATTTGSGVHLFTSSLASANSPKAGVRFLPWQTAQAEWVQQSLRLSSEFNTAIAHTGAPVTFGRTSLQPLDSLACPAVAIEVAPLAATARSEGSSISDEAYQAKIINALSAAIVQWRADRKQ